MNICMSSDLIELFSKLTIHDTRQNKQEDDINILTKMMTNLQITEPDNIDDLINEMEQLTITDDEVIIEFKNNQIITFRYAYFNCGDKLLNSMPKWCDSY